MSSHHFVKEGQEPALLILDAPTFEVAGPLLEWAPLVVVAKHAVGDVLLWSIKMDVVLADEKSAPELRNDLADQSPLTILSHQPGESPLVSGLHFLIRKKQTGVNIFAAEIDSTILQVEAFVDRLQISIINENLKWSSVTSGHFEKWLSSGTPLFLRESKPQQNIDLNGLRKVNAYFQAVDDGMIRIQSDALFWVGEIQAPAS